MYLNNKISHTVLKNSDIENYCLDEDIYNLEVIKEKIRLGRLQDGKPIVNEYFVINKDEPYVDRITDVIELGEFNKRN